MFEHSAFLEKSTYYFIWSLTYSKNLNSKLNAIFYFIAWVIKKSDANLNTHRGSCRNNWIIKNFMSVSSRLGHWHAAAIAWLLFNFLTTQNYPWHQNISAQPLNSTTNIFIDTKLPKYFFYSSTKSTNIFQQINSFNFFKLNFNGPILISISIEIFSLHWTPFRQASSCILLWAW